MPQAPWKPTACILCECNCGLEVQLGGDDGRHLTRIRGDDGHPASRGYACEKPHRLDHYQHGPDRLTTPLRRRIDGSFEAIDWNTAIREVAARLAKVRDTWDGESIFYYGGGGQGNHLPGAYSTATRRALGSRYRSSALAQEKTGEFWVADRMMGTVTRADFEHCQVAFFLGKNPWHSHSIPRARVTLKEIARDPHRTLVVVDPRLTETAALADIHLQVKPGTDAWLLAALVRVLFEEHLVATGFVGTHAVGLDEVKAAFQDVSVARCCEASGVGEDLVRKTARVLAKARSMASFEDLGVQMNLHSTLVSYLHHLLVALTGNLGKPGSHYVPTTLVPLAGGESRRTSPVAGARIVAGLVPCNVIADEILTDHARRYRAMLVEAANPAHSLAESPRFREALRALDTVVVIDVAMTETAREAHYVLPAATQFEKAEATFFNFEFPKNVFQLRARLMPPLPGSLPEAEIHARLCEALGAVTAADLAPLRDAAARGRLAYGEALLERTMGIRAWRHRPRCCSTGRCRCPTSRRRAPCCWGWPSRRRWSTRRRLPAPGSWVRRSRWRTRSSTRCCSGDRASSSPSTSGRRCSAASARRTGRSTSPCPTSSGSWPMRSPRVPRGPTPPSPSRSRQASVGPSRRTPSSVTRPGGRRTRQGRCG